MTEENNGDGDNRTKIYFFYMIIILMFVEILDTYTTNYPNVIPSKIIEEFLSNYPENIATSIYMLCGAIATVGMYFVFLNQFMADKAGRKLLLGITVLGMGVSSLLLALSTNIIQYTIFLFLLYMFFSSDIWVIYINEECDPEKRAFWTNIVLIGGVTGALLIPVFRSIYITETGSNWRGMTYFAIILGIVLSIIVLSTFIETSKYLEIKEEKLAIDESRNLLIENIKTLFTSEHKNEFKIILIISFIAGLNYIFIHSGEIFISSNPNLNENDINTIVMVMSISAVLGYLITALVADKYGRKPLLYIYSALLPISIFIIVIGSTLSEGALIVVCIGAGLANIAFWGLGIVVRIITLEIIPTNVRGTGSGFKSLIGAAGITSGLVISSVITFYFGLAAAFLIYSIILLINLPLVYFYIKETKGINLSDV